MKVSFIMIINATCCFATRRIAPSFLQFDFVFNKTSVPLLMNRSKRSQKIDLIGWLNETESEVAEMPCRKI